MVDIITEQKCSKCRRVRLIKFFNRISQLSEKREKTCASCRYKHRMERAKLKAIPFVRPQIVLSESATIINNATRVIHEGKEAQVWRL